MSLKLTERGSNILTFSWPMVTFAPHGPMTTPGMLNTLEKLAAQQQRLSTDTAFFEEQATSMQAALWHLEQRFGQPSKFKKLLLQQPLVVEHLAQLTAAALRQLASHLDSNVAVSTAAVALAAAFSLLFPYLTGRDKKVPDAASTSSDTAILTIVADTGAKLSSLLSSLHAVPRRRAPLRLPVHTCH